MTVLAARVCAALHFDPTVYAMHSRDSMTIMQPSSGSFRGSRPATIPGRRLTDHDPASRRQVVDLVATARITGSDLRDRICRVRSLSLGGAFVELDRLAMGTLVNLTFCLPSLDGRGLSPTGSAAEWQRGSIDDKLSLEAVVHWSSERGVSVLFDSLRASEVWILWQFLAKAARDAGAGERTRREHTVVGFATDL